MPPFIHHITNLLIYQYSIEALEPFSTEMPLRRLVIIEPPYFGREGAEGLLQLYKVVATSNARRQRSWDSVESAVEWLMRRRPWSGYHAEVRQIISVSRPAPVCRAMIDSYGSHIKETYFRRDPADYTRITTKTMPEQESACFFDDGYHLRAQAHIRAIMRCMPVHVICGAKNDLW